MKLKNSKAKIISILLLIMMLFNFITPLKSNAVYMAGTGILTKPILWFGISAMDSINIGIAAIFCGENNFRAIKEDLEDNVTEINIDEPTGRNELLQKAVYNFMMSPDKIFTGQVSLLNANLFKADSSKNLIQTLEEDFKGGIGSDLAGALKKSVAGIYVILRNICAVILLCLLIYTGIRILIAAGSPLKQAEWKVMLFTWIKALCLLIFMHYIMIGIFYISDLLVDALKQGWGDNSIIAIIRYAFKNHSIFDGTGCFLYFIMYIYVTILTLYFFFAYFKRLIWIVILTVISPVVATTYAVGRGTAQIFTKWFKEYIYAVLIQPFHMLIFYVLIILPLGLNYAPNTTGVGAVDKFIEIFVGTDYSNITMQIYVIISMGMIRPAEKFLMRLFDFNNQSIAKEVTTETGKRITTEVVDTAVKTVETVGMVAAAVAVPVLAPEVAGAMAGEATGALAGEATGALAGEATGALAGEATGEVAGEVAGEATEEVAGEVAEETAGTLEEAPSETADANMPRRSGNLNTPESTENANVTGVNNSQSELSEAARKLSEVADKLFGDKNNSLLDRLLSPAAKEKGYEVAQDLNTLRGEMYLSGDNSSKEFENGLISQMYKKARIPEVKKQKLEEYVNNEDNINFMIEQHGLLDESRLEAANKIKDEDKRKLAIDKEHDSARKKAQDMLKGAEPYINRGITDIKSVDALISRTRPGSDPNMVIKNYARGQNYVNNNNSIRSMQQVVARETGFRENSPQVISQAKGNVQAASKYIEAGVKNNAEVLNGLVRLENALKGNGLGAIGNNPQYVMKMDKIIQKAVKDNLEKIVLPKSDSSAEIKRIEQAMNDDLAKRRSI